MTSAKEANRTLLKAIGCTTKPTYSTFLATIFSLMQSTTRSQRLLFLCTLNSHCVPFYKRLEKTVENSVSYQQFETFIFTTC